MLINCLDKHRFVHRHCKFRIRLIPVSLYYKKLLFIFLSCLVSVSKMYRVQTALVQRVCNCIQTIDASPAVSLNVGTISSSGYIVIRFLNNGISGFSPCGVSLYEIELYNRRIFYLLGVQTRCSESPATVIAIELPFRVP